MTEMTEAMKRFKPPFTNQGLYLIDSNGFICGRIEIGSNMGEAFDFAKECVDALNFHYAKKGENE